VLIANSNIVPAWATQDNFDKWEKEGLIMYGQMTAGSWIYIGTQGILQGTYETLGSLARQHGWGSLKGKLTVTAGLGEMGGAQPLAVTMNEGVGLFVEVDRWRAERRLALRQVDRITDNLEEAMTWVEEALGAKGAALGGADRQRGRGPARAGGTRRGPRRGHRPDLRPRPAVRLYPGRAEHGAGQRSARQRPGRVPAPLDGVDGPPRAGHAGLEGQGRGGLRLRQQYPPARLRLRRQGCFQLPGLRAGLYPPLFCEGKGPFRWVALSGDPQDLYATDEAILELFPEDKHLQRWIRMAQEQIEFQGLPARICWLGYGERARPG
jgi:urocanate hydratase